MRAGEPGGDKGLSSKFQGSVPGPALQSCSAYSRPAACGWAWEPVGRGGGRTEDGWGQLER